MATYYWVGGSGTWDDVTATNWASSSGGSGGAGVPGQFDDVIFDANSNTGTNPFTVSITYALCLNFTINSLDGVMTLVDGTGSSSGTFLINDGNLTLPSTNFVWNFTGIFGLYKTSPGIQTITTNGITLNCTSIFFSDNGAYSANIKLLDNLTTTGDVVVTPYYSLGIANIDLNGKTLTSIGFDAGTASALNNPININFGTTGKILLNGISSYFFSILQTTITGTSLIEYSLPTGSSASYNNLGSAVNVKVTGLGRIDPSGNILDLNFTGFSGTLGIGTRTISGNLTLATGMTTVSTTTINTFKVQTGDTSTKTITTNGVNINFPVTMAGGNFQLQDAFTVATAARLFTFTPNTNGLSANLDLNNFTLTVSTFQISSPSIAKSINFGTSGKIVVTRGGAVGTAWNCTDLSTFTYTGNSRVEFTYSGASLTRNIRHGTTSGGSENTALNFYVTAGSDIFDVAASHIKNFDLTGSSVRLSNGTGTDTSIYGNLVLTSTSSYSTEFRASFKGSSGTKYITNNGCVGTNGPVVSYTFNGANCTWVFNDNFTQIACTSLVSVSGTIDFNDKQIQALGLYNSSGSNFSRWYLRSSSIRVTALGFYNGSTDVIVYPGSSSISVTNTVNPTEIYLGNLSFNNLIIENGSFNSIKLYGGGTLSSITNNKTIAHTMSFQEGKIYTFGSYTSNGSSGQQITMSSQTPGSSYTLAKSNSTKVNLSYCTISDCFAGNASVWIALTSNGNINAGNNYGIQFTQPTGKALQFFS